MLEEFQGAALERAWVLAMGSGPGDAGSLIATGTVKADRAWIGSRAVRLEERLGEPHLWYSMILRGFGGKGRASACRSNGACPPGADAQASRAGPG